MNPMSARMFPVAPSWLPRMAKSQSITFKGVGPDGIDIYDVIFDRGKAEWRIAPLAPDGKTIGRSFRELP